MATREIDPDDATDRPETAAAAGRREGLKRAPHLVADNVEGAEAPVRDRSGVPGETGREPDSARDGAGEAGRTARARDGGDGPADSHDALPATPLPATSRAAGADAGDTDEPGPLPSLFRRPRTESGERVSVLSRRVRPLRVGNDAEDAAPAETRAPRGTAAAYGVGTGDAESRHALPPLPEDPPPPMPRGLEWPSWVAGAVSLFWLAFFAFYIQQSVGWNNLFMLLPHEFAGFAAGALIPVALAWALVAVFTRDGRYGREALILRDQLRKLAYPTDTARGQMSDVARSLTEQARMLTDASRHALSEARQVRDGLHTEVVALSSLAEKFREDIAQVIRDAEGQVYGLEDATERAVSRARDAGQTLERQSSTLTEAADKMMAQTRTLDDSLRKHVQDLTLAGQQAREQGNGIRAINESIAKSVREGRGLGDELSKLLGEVDEHLGGQQSRLDDLRERWERAAEGVSTLMASRAESIETVSDRLLSRTQVIETTIGRQTDALMSASDQSMARLKEMEGVFTRRVQTMNVTVDEATNRLSDASLMVAQRGQEAMSATAEATGTLERAASTLDDMLRTLGVAVQRAEQRARDAGAAVKEQAQALEGHTVEANRHANDIREAITAQSKELADGAKLIGHQLELVQSGLQQQARYLGDAAGTAANRIEDTVDSLRQQLTELSTISSQVNQELECIGLSLADHAETLEATGERTVSHTHTAAAAVRSETENLQRMVSEVHKALEGLEESLAARNLAISRAAESADGKLAETAQIIEGKVRVISECTAQANESLESTALALDGRVNDVDGIVNRSIGRMGDMGTTLEQHARLFEEVTGRGLSQATVAGNRLRQSTDGIQAAAEKAAETVRGAASLLGGSLEEADERARALIPLLERAVDGIRQEVDGMALSGEKMTETTRRISAEFGRQTKALVDAAGQAEERAGTLRLEMERAEVTTFLHQASFVIERLESVAVDIARIFNPVRDEELWRRYQKGDHGVFLRHLARVMTVRQHGAVREIFDSDREFRGYVTQFVTDYESLLEQTRQTARADILTALFIGSDLGKVYLVLAKALGRLEE
ncbi:hypothetical protein F1188_04655 [Roseospira marina]|uniref:ATPase n=1 Tax=Roseospira marina TaxID=140057 RepID=A0A5M6IEB8_9PROT|nr:hypothetical protein [Roseospira marina]KAA5606631.1 hypothetical protein F1188_04655 [Roseospira marina]MBB4313964.1 uncharacterized protein YukE [Roseospira marina]MBB5087126.1 uncharacterized protein YukE [Roseospira marina]